MTGVPAGENAGELTFRHFSGETVVAVATADGGECPVGEFLTARNITLDDGTRLRQVRVAAGARRDAGYESLDNEILAGRRLHDVTRSARYPASVSFLYGDKADSASPCALLRPYQGRPLSEVVSQMLPDEQRAFEVSLLTGLCWLAAAGIAHRGLSPSAVRWDSRERQAQITDFSHCTVFGVSRRPSVTPDQAVRGTRPDGTTGGLVTSRDDMYAAGLLIHYVCSQGDAGPPTPDRLAAAGLTGLEPLFGPPEGRPTARELLASHLGVNDPVPRTAAATAGLAAGAELFEFWRDKKRESQGRAVPPPPPDPGRRRESWRGGGA
jgi:serine/threonine protein kinase